MLKQLSIKILLHVPLKLLLVVSLHVEYILKTVTIAHFYYLSCPDTDDHCRLKK